MGTASNSSAGSRGPFIGIDLGTSNCKVAFVWDDPRAAKGLVTVRAVEFRSGNRLLRVVKSPTFPSLVARDGRSKKALTGWAALDEIENAKKKRAPLRHGHDFFRSVKSDIGSRLTYPWSFSEDLRRPAQVLGLLIREILNEAARTDLRGVDLLRQAVTISVPASYGAGAREETLEAAEAAGLDRSRVQLIDEPVAAVIDLLNSTTAASFLDVGESKNVLVFDYGGGTCDLSLVEVRFDDAARTGLHVRNLAISNYLRSGGDDIDRAILEKFVLRQISGIEFARGPERQALIDILTVTVARELKEKMCHEIRKASHLAPRSGRQREISVTHPAPKLKEPDEVKLPRHFTLEESEFRSIMATFVQVPEVVRTTLEDQDEREDPEVVAVLAEQFDEGALIAPIFETLAKAGLSAGDLDVIVLHGASCQNPIVEQVVSAATSTLLGKHFRPAIVLQTPNLDASVACGAAISSFWKTKHGLDFVRPIMAEDLGVVTRGGSVATILEAGTPVPFPEAGVHAVEAEFFTAQDAQPVVLVPLCRGREHVIVGSVKVPLAPKTPKGERVTISIRVDRNKTLRWWFTCGPVKDHEAELIHDPWTADHASPELRRLFEIRSRIRAAVLTGVAPTTRDLMDEALALARAGQSDHRTIERALLMLDDVAGSDAAALGPIENLRGILLGWLERWQEAAEAHRRATEHAPRDAVMVGNYGWALVDAKRPDVAVAKLREALGLNPNLYYCYERLGDAYRSMGNEDQALTEYREALRRLNEVMRGNEHVSANVWWQVARVKRAIGDYDGSRAAIAEATRVNKQEQLGGDPDHQIAGEDSGFLWLDRGE